MTAIDRYIQEILQEYATGIASEHAYRPALKILLESVDAQIIAVNDPRRIAVGAPDFIIIKDELPLCYVEAKDIDKDLKRVERDAQLTRYRKAFHSLLLTNSLEFRWYLDGELKQTVRIAKLQKNQIVVDSSQFETLSTLLQQFMAVGVAYIGDSHELAKRLADRAHQIAQLIEKSLSDSESLQVQKQAFEETLLPDLKDFQFADMYAQTLAYGLFAARANHEGAIGSFSRRGAWDDIPKTNPFLREFFQRILGDMDPRVEWMVDDLVKLLAYSDTDELLADFGRRSRREDPVLHFYETFLTEYNPALREKRGVYYTPEPIVNYMVRIVDDILQQQFNLVDGIADKQTLILDPATGTGTFLYTLIQHIHATHFQSQAGAWDDYVRDGLLPRLFGFELLVASYAVAHMKLGILLKETGYQFTDKQRLNIFLTNTLEDSDKQAPLAFAKFISDEANAAVAIKRDKPIMIVMGNPPYSGHSANR
ncbi:MAG: N-6 DNA methylase, partial [Anaerolineae bacterium]|nr:N-6 DNA methylase [Anaerolineae bacterium]